MPDVTFRILLTDLGSRHLSAKFGRGLSIQDTKNRIDDPSVPDLDGFNAENLVKKFFG